jgi:hypothetical protein
MLPMAKELTAKDVLIVPFINNIHGEGEIEKKVGR